MAIAIAIDIARHGSAKKPGDECFSKWMDKESAFCSVRCVPVPLAAYCVRALTRGSAAAAKTAAAASPSFVFNVVEGTEKKRI